MKRYETVFLVALVCGIASLWPWSRPARAGWWGAASSAATVDDGAITTNKLGGGAVTSSKVGDGEIATAKLRAASVTETKLAPAAVTTDKLAAGSVTTGKLHSDALNGFSGVIKVVDGTVTSSKLQLGDGTHPACIMLGDSDGAGCTELNVLDGNPSYTTDADCVCDGS